MRHRHVASICPLIISSKGSTSRCPEPTLLLHEHDQPVKKQDSLLVSQDHNSWPENSHKLALNRFADWHKDEFLATILPNHGQIRSAISAEGKQPKLHKPQVPEHMLPSTLDWRGTGADSPVKDQASCGSCWVRPLGLVSALTAVLESQAFGARAHASFHSRLKLQNIFCQDCLEIADCACAFLAET